MKTQLKIFKALSDKNRLRIVKMLEIKPMCVCEITSVLGRAPSTVSKHLSILQEAELIEDTKDGKWVNYALPSRGQDLFVRDVLRLLRYALDNDPEIIEDRKKAEGADRIQLCQ
jgi:ArsR family transcriptional regulator